MFAPLAATMIIAILVSLLVALTIIPVASEWLLRQNPEKEFRPVRALHRGYLALLDRARRARWVTVAISVVVLVVATFAATRIGTEFIPNLDEGAVAINVVRLPNASLDGAATVSAFIERRLRERFPEVTAVVSKTGRAEISEDPMGPEQTDVLIMLKPRKEWTSAKSKPELVAALQSELSKVPGIRLSFSQPISLRVNELISGVKSDLAIKFFGEDIVLLKKYADQAAAVLGGIEGAEDARVEQVSGMEQVEVTLDRQAMARYGIKISDVNETLEIALAGMEATRVVEGQRRVAVTVRFPPEARADLDAIGQILFAGVGGERVSLAKIATIATVEGPAQISREKGMRRVAAEVNIRGRDLGGFVAEAKEKLTQLESDLPSGYFLEYGGQFENQQRAMRRLSVVVPLALALVFVLLYMALGSFRDSLLVVLNLPFALVGGVLAISAIGMPLSVSAAVAFIVLLGIAVQNGVVLIAFFRQLRAEGRSVAETVREGCDQRFRPLIMTALCSFIGHVPMLFATGSGADIQKPLAVVVMGGLVTSTILTLIVLPTIYEWIENRKETSDTEAAS
jgi:cobalt-zinc-cadmium resistance protein CzcA